LDNVTTVVIFGPLIILITQAMKVNPIPYLLAAALLSDTGGVATLVGDPPNLMIGSAADIDFNTFFKHMGGIVFVAWVGTLLALRFLTRKHLAVQPTGSFDEHVPFHDKGLWIKAVWVLIGMTVLFILHGQIGWEPWMVAATGLVALLLMGKHLEIDNVMEQVEMQLLIFFVSLFVLIGGVEHTGFLEWVGAFILPLVQSDLMVAALVLMWISAVISAAIDNIPFTAAMIPIILGLETQGVNVAPLWWSLALGVGMGGNGTHIGSTANVYIVTISERLAKRQGDPSLAITPLQWFKVGTPVMLLTLMICTVIMYSFWDFFAVPLR
jgi:Na+/H+ antiporter NhaD/arsenite permease-like protein